MSRDASVKPLWDDLPLRRYLSEVATRMGVVEILALDNLRDLPRIRIETIYVPPLLAEYAVDAESDPKRWPPGQSLIDALAEYRRLVVLGDPGGGKTTLANWLAWRLSAGLSTPLPPFLADKVPLPCVLREVPAAVLARETPLSGLVEHVVRRLLGDQPSDELRATLQARVAAGRYVLILDGIDEIPLAGRDRVRHWLRTASAQDACVLATSRIVGYDDWPVDRMTPHNWLRDRLPESLWQPTPPSIAATEATTPKGVTPVAQPFTAWFRSLEVATIKARVDYLSATKTFLEGNPGGDSEPAVPDGKALRNEPAWATRRYLMPFDDARIAAFATNWYAQRCASAIEAGEKAADLVAAVSRHAVTLRLARTPNLLTLMAVVHRERADLPDGKAVLYDEIANAYINSIDSGRKLAGVPDRLAHHDWKERKSWLAYVAFCLQKRRSSEDEQSGLLAGETEVCAWLAEAMRRSGVADARLAARDCLAWVARRSGLLLPRGDGIYAFVHLSFQEYFCACHLAQRMLTPAYIRRGVSPDETFRREDLRDWAGQTLWRETLVFLFEKLSAEQDPAWIEDLAHDVFPEDAGASPSDPVSQTRLALAARVIGDRHVRLDASTREALISRCLETVWLEYWGMRSGRVHSSGVLPLLVEGGIACIVRGDDSHRDGSDALPGGFEDIPHCTVAELQHLGSPKALRLLIVRDSDWSDSIAFDSFPELLFLALDNTAVSDVSALAGLTGLQKLSLQDTAVSDVSALAGLTGLQGLWLANTTVSDVSALAGLTGLQELWLANTTVSDVSALAGLTGLRALSLANTGVSDVSALAGLTGLRVLSLEKTAVSDVSALAGLTGLQLLWLAKTTVSDVSALAGLTGLRALSLENTAVSDVSALADLRGLQNLWLGDTAVSDVSALAGLLGLEELSLENTRVSDVSALAGLTGLRELSLENTPVRDVSALADLKGLQQLSLKNTAISDVVALAPLTNLKIVGLGRGARRKRQRRQAAKGPGPSIRGG